MSKISIFFSPYKSKAISKQNSNSAGWEDAYSPNKKPAILTECPICKTKVKRLEKHLNKIHKTL
jgi:hypothetical protein